MPGATLWTCIRGRHFERTASALGVPGGGLRFSPRLVAAATAGAVATRAVLCRRVKLRGRGNPFFADPTDECASWTTGWSDPAPEDEK